jgi:putative endonuclease
VNHLEVGRRGEEIARALLRSRGYRILDTNVRGRFGEIDIVARKDRCHVFVEVRARTGDGYGTPEESITQRKRDRMVACALDYVARHGELHDAPWRIDVVAVEMDDQGHRTRAEVIESAVPMD